MKIVTTTNGVQPIIDAAYHSDHIAPLSEQFLRGLHDSTHHHFVALDPDPVGLIAYDGQTAELVVHPAFRRRGIATQLLVQLGDVPIWAHGNLPSAQAFATAKKKKPVRELLVMAVTAREFEVQWPIDINQLNLSEAVAKYGQEKVDHQWLIANNQAFAWHPEQGGWDQSRLDKARNTDWFREEDFLTFWDGAQLIGFHWTKRHGDLAAGADGEVYVVGLADAGRGKGLGTPLVAAGLRHLVGLGAQRIILYVESDNKAAVAAYKNLGFATIETHVLYI